MSTRTAIQNVRLASVAIFFGILSASLTIWLLWESDARKFNLLKENALCVLELPAGVPSISATFTIPRPVARFNIAVAKRKAPETLSLSITGEKGVVGSISFGKISPFSLGAGVRAGKYTATLCQEANGKGGLVVIAGELPVRMTPWQLLSRAYATVLALSGLAVLATRKAKATKAGVLSFTAFHTLLLGFTLMFIYLLFHEGGHAMAEMAFGCFDWGRSDFWGIHSHPHSGGTGGALLKPWQQVVISCAGPMFPTLAGFALFALWSIPLVRKLRSLRPMLNLYCSATMAILVFSESILGPVYLLGLITAEGDLIGYATKTSGPVWLVKTVLCGSFLISVFILWRVLPEIQRAWKAQFMQAWKA